MKFKIFSKNFLRKLLLITLAINLNLFNIGIIYAADAPYDYSKSGVDKSITKFLCTPTQQSSYSSAGNSFSGMNDPQKTQELQYAAQSTNTAQYDLYSCINKLYKFAIAIGSAFAVFFIVLAGFLYMSAEGDSEGVNKAKEMLAASLTGLVILLIGYVFLKAINPDLITFKNIQPPSVKVQTSDLNAGRNSSNNGTNSIDTSICKTDVGSCSLAQMAQCGAWNANTASGVCYIESGRAGRPDTDSGSDLCKDRSPWSIGLFQINLIVHQGQSYMPAACRTTMIKTNGKGTAQGNCMPGQLKRNANGVEYCAMNDCEIINRPAYNSCVEELHKASTNIDVACKLYQKNNWQPWKNTYNVVCKAGSNIKPSNQTPEGGVLVLGDSLMVNMKTTFASKETLNSNSTATVGRTISQSFSDLQSKLSSIKNGPPAIAYISLGTNDFSNPKEQIQTAQIKYIKALSDAGVTKIIWIGPPAFPQPNNSNITAKQNMDLNDYLKAGAASAGAKYFDTYNSGLNLYSANARDIHPANNSVWANAILSAFPK